MLLVEGLREENFLQYIAAKVLSRVGTMRGMAATLIFLCFFSSMFITNDVSLITFVPLGVMMLRMASLRRKLCYTVTLMTIAANLGSMFTPIGNPQNLYLFALSGLSLPPHRTLRRGGGAAAGGVRALWLPPPPAVHPHGGDGTSAPGKHRLLSGPLSAVRAHGGGLSAPPGTAGGGGDSAAVAEPGAVCPHRLLPDPHLCVLFYLCGSLWAI